MDFRTRLTNWSLAVLLLGVPLCAALALEHAAGTKERNRFPRVEATSPKPAAPAASLPTGPESAQPRSPQTPRS